jgi:ATP/maltotriose-dependent transcriptional regulator MalT
VFAESIAEMATSTPPAPIAPSLERLGRALAVADEQLREARRCYRELIELGRLTTSGASPGADLNGLTVQGWRVAILVASGKRDREVAESLHLSVHTVKTHVKKILATLELHSRWQVRDLLTASGRPGQPPEPLTFPRACLADRPGGVSP